MSVSIPPIKCQGIKTKLIPLIAASVPKSVEGRWIEPFCGSGVVAMNIRPKRALLADTNKHIIALYRAIQQGTVNPTTVKEYLEREGSKLSTGGADYYKEVRQRFNAEGNSLDFLFLNRACFNGLMRFNRFGYFNVPYNHKPARFRQAYVTKVTNQVRAFAEVLYNKDWTFEVADFRVTLSRATEQDFVYVDPPYAGRHVDYYNSWSEQDEAELTSAIKRLPCRFLLSTWHSNKHRENAAVHTQWSDTRFFMRTFDHFYHVGPTEDLRNSMLEALISNYQFPPVDEQAMAGIQATLFEEDTLV